MSKTNAPVQASAGAQRATGFLGGNLFAIGPYRFNHCAVLAPMAGVSDLPQRELCTKFGAAFTVSEMVTADVSLWRSRKSSSRLQWGETAGPRIVQIAGADPQMMAEAARSGHRQGADIIDINMGCPAKKVCAKAAGSALLRDEALVKAIVEAVVDAVAIPVTLKIRTGWDSQTRNALRVGELAQTAGIQALTIHGRTRACRFNGTAEYDTVTEVAKHLQIPVIANGDIDSAAKAHEVLRRTGAAAVMVGRAAQGNPWIFTEINRYLASGEPTDPPTINEMFSVLLHHLRAIHRFYGEFLGARIARKVFGWYLQCHLRGTAAELAAEAKQYFNTLSSTKEQLTAVHRLHDRLQQLEDQAA